MVKMKLKLAKSGRINPSTKKMGYAARVVTNGKAGYEDIVEEACRHTTLHKAEAKVALELCMETVAEMLMQGYIVDLGPVGKLYPSCTSGWAARPEDLRLGNVVPSFYYRAADKLVEAVKGASLQWLKESDAEGDGAAPGGDGR